jgi:23S rRNA pseudouridine1911/1915/1917 synthase
MAESQLEGMPLTFRPAVMVCGTMSRFPKIPSISPKTRIIVTQHPEQEEKTALEWLARDYPDSPKKRLKEWFARGRVRLDGELVSKPHVRLADPGGSLRMGEAVPSAKVLLKQMPTRIHAQVNLLYIDSALAIVNKGPGLLSVPLPGRSPGQKNQSAAERQPSALSLLEGYLQTQAGGVPGGKRPERKHLSPLPVHRLDQYTSGLLCFAMNPQAREHLVDQVRSHSFIREYLALADGVPDPAKGTWRSWFKLDDEGMEQTVRDEPFEGATEAISHYDVLDTIQWPVGGGRLQRVSRLRLRLETGLKHQLRIHAARAGVPLLGDRSYHPDFKKAADHGAKPPHGCKRQALHASSIGFIHPESGQTKRFSCKFPKDLATLEQSLRGKKMSI